jgi:hypothetical protein
MSITNNTGLHNSGYKNVWYAMLAFQLSYVPTLAPL